MIYRIFTLLLISILFTSCATKHQINIGDILVTNQESNQQSLVTDKYMSFTQEFYENMDYPINEYCDDKRVLLSNDKFSTETYLKITNERTKQNRVGKYPIWFLVNDDEAGIRCVRKSTNFINEEPFVVSDSDILTLKILQKNQEEKRVPIRELNVLINMVSLLVPQTANFFMKSSSVINDPITKRYLDTMENAFKNGNLDGTKSKSFTPKTKSIKIELYVPYKDKSKKLGYIILKPKYRTTLSTVEVINNIPNFRYIYTSFDPRIEDIMDYKLKSKGLRVKQEVDNFSHLANEYIIDALRSLNIHLLNRFTTYDRGLILALALKQTNLYKKFYQAIRYGNISKVKRYLIILNDKNNPLNGLNKLLKPTGIEYYTLIEEANDLIKKQMIALENKKREDERRKQEETKRQIELQGIENFLRPVAKWSYIPKMFAKDVKIVDTQNNSYSIGDLQEIYNRDNSVISYGCYINLQNPIHGVSVQDYLIHPNYTDGIKYNYMALSVDKNKVITILFYKFSSENNLLKITNILIDKDGYFIMKDRLKEVLRTQPSKMCYRNILSNI